MNKPENIQLIKEKADALLDQQVDFLKRLTAFDSETHFIEGNKSVIELVKQEYDGMDVTFTEIPYDKVGTHLMVKVNEGAGGGRILLNAHLDTVFPVGFAKEHQPHVEGDWLHGLGTIDCKGGVAVSCYALKVLHALKLLPKDKEIDVLYTCDEEQGSQTGQELYARYCPGAEAAFVFEPGDYAEDQVYKILTSRQGVILGNLDIKGVEAHAGCDYSKGRSANKELAYKILELYSLNDDDKGIYYNAAPVSGGRPNGVVSGDANMQFCVAGIPDMDAYHECEEKLDKLGSWTNDPDCTVDLTYRMLFPPQARNEKADQIVRDLMNIAQVLGIRLEEDGVNPAGEDIYPATDANYMAMANIPAVDGLGPVGSGMHTTDEKVYIPSLAEKTALFAAYLANIQS